MSSNGKYVRMIPSLNGGIYKFDGDSIEAIPVTADDLIKSSFKFSDDMLISGGHEKRTYGVNCRTGEVIYEQSIGGSRNWSDRVQENDSLDYDPLLDDILVVTRHTQTVRASEPRTGSERWNFSIGHHELQISMSDNCRQQVDNSDDLNNMIFDMDIRVIVPEGLICGYSKKDPTNLLWMHKFDSPIVSVFRPDKENILHSVDLFENAHWLWEEHGNDHYIRKSGNLNLSPSLYLGMYHQQLYIQESKGMRASLDHKKTHLNLAGTNDVVKIPFKPIPAANNPLIDFVTNVEDENDTEEVPSDRKDLIPIDSQAVLQAFSKVEGRGFYFYTEEEWCNQSSYLTEKNQSRKQGKSTNEDPSLAEDYWKEQYLVRHSLWYYWKEVVVLSLTTAFLINFLLRNQNKVDIVYVPIAKEAMDYEEEESAKQREIDMLRNEAQAKLRSISESSGQLSPGIDDQNYVSRFLTDFELVQCLGKGGFGVVFEVKNQLDDCCYAIKRILLPSKKESRERVLREVKTLANCEHKNIVRYFHAWVEQPPKNWQEQKDKEIFSRDIFSTSITIESPSPTEESKMFLSHITDTSVQTKKQQTTSNTNWLINLNKQKFADFSEAKFDDDDDSFIQFKAETNDGMKARSQSQSCADESFAIEFLNSNDTSIEDKSLVISITADESNTRHDEDEKKKVKKHRRNFSLDLSTSTTNLLPKKLNGIDVATTSNVKMYLYIQMQLCMKTSLKDWLKENDLNARKIETVEIWNQIIQAVHYVHLKGLIHRDLKPSNIFFALDGQIKIGDFGLVTDMSDIPIDPITSSNSSNSSANFELDYSIIGHKKHTQRVGTSLYMSPEQAKGQSYNYKVDIYSLGLIFFELLNYFHTETERYKVLQALKNNKFPDDFVDGYEEEVSNYFN